MESKAFEAISDFVADLHSIYEDDKHLALYNRLIEKITVRDKTAMKKHITIFINYTSKNLELIMAHKIQNLPRIVCSQEKGIYIDLAVLTKNADKDILTSIENHLLNICMLLNPNDMKIKETLLSHFAKSAPVSSEGGKEQEFINEFLHNISSATENGGDMGQAMMAGMQMLPKAFSAMTSGELDPMKFIGTAFQTMQQFNGGQDPIQGMDPSMMQNMMNPQMMQNMMSMMQNMSLNENQNSGQLALENPKDEIKE